MTQLASIIIVTEYIYCITDFPHILPFTYGAAAFLCTAGVWQISLLKRDIGMWKRLKK